jgi:hypothetical protein
MSNSGSKKERGSGTCGLGSTRGTQGPIPLPRGVLQGCLAAARPNQSAPWENHLEQRSGAVQG